MYDVEMAGVSALNVDRVLRQGDGLSIKTYGRVKKPNTVRHSIKLNPSTPLALKGSLQEKIYLKEYAHYNQAAHFKLHKDLETGEHFLTDLNGTIIRGKDLKPVYAYVIVEMDGHLELRLGLNNHYFLADRAESVIAAGDMYFGPQTSSYNEDKKEIIKITNQSGGYHAA